jgi:cation diffusion facilitator family transporter
MQGKEQQEHRAVVSHKAAQGALAGIAANLLLATTKGTAGFLGNSYALIADAVESLSDILSSVIVLFGCRMAGKPADANHPYGHGKFEPLATATVALILFAAAAGIALSSIREISTPHHAPAPFTLAVLVAVIVVKELLFRSVLAVGIETGSSAVTTDAWHHRADSLTSGAAFIGISVALLGGPGYEAADDYAALMAAAIIALNAGALLKPAISELIDTAPDPQIAARVRAIAHGVNGVLGTHKCNIRKVGFDHFVDLDVLCDPEMSIRQGHNVAHDVGEAIQAELPYITKVLVHVEPSDDYGRRSRT